MIDKLTVLLSLGGCFSALPLLAQRSHLEEYFDRLRHTPLESRVAVQRDGPLYGEAALGNLEREVAALLQGLDDRDDYIRLQATAFLRAVQLLRMAPPGYFDQFVPALSRRVSDKALRVAFNALECLAMIEPRPPQDAETAFLTALERNIPQVEGPALTGLARLAFRTQRANETIAAMFAAEAGEEALKRRLNGLAPARELPEPFKLALLKLLTSGPESLYDNVLKLLEKPGIVERADVPALTRVLESHAHVDSAVTERIRKLIQTASEGGK